MIPNRQKREAKYDSRSHYLMVKKDQHYLEEKHQEIIVIFIVRNFFRTKSKLESQKKYVKINIFVMQIYHLKTLKY